MAVTNLNYSKCRKRHPCTGKTSIIQVRNILVYSKFNVYILWIKTKELKWNNNYLLLYQKHSNILIHGSAWVFALSSCYLNIEYFEVWLPVFHWRKLHFQSPSSCILVAGKYEDWKSTTTLLYFLIWKKHQYFWAVMVSSWFDIVRCCAWPLSHWVYTWYQV